MIKKCEKKFKFNIIDGLVIALALVCICTIVCRALVIDDKYNTDYSSFTVCFEINEDNIVPASLHLWTQGILIRTSDGREIGRLQEELTVEKREEYNDSEESALAQIRNWFCGRITVSGVLTDRGFVLNSGLSISVNDEIEVVTEYVKTTIKIVAIEKNGV